MGTVKITENLIDNQDTDILYYLGVQIVTTIDLSNKADLVGGLIPQSQLPSYVDDILEFANLASFPVIGEVGKIYIAISPKNLQYRWTGSVYLAITNGFIASTDDIPESVSRIYFTTTEKSKLASITEIFTTALKTAYDNSVTWISTNGTNLINHLSNTSNPHSTTKAQVGLSNVDNTSDVNKPISIATQNSLDLKANLAGGNTFTGNQNFNISVAGGFTNPIVTTDNAEGGNFASIILRTSRGTLITPLALQLGDVIGSWLARSYNGSAYTVSGVVGLRGFTTENHTTSANGSKLVIETIANGTIIRRAVAEFGQDGGLTLLGNTLSAGSSYLNKIYVFNGTTFSHEINGNPTANRVVTLPNRNFTVAGTDELVVTLTGDVTGTGTGSFTTTIANSSVTFAKQANINTNKLLGRGTAGSGLIEEITLGTNLSLTGTTLNVTGSGSGITRSIISTSGSITLGAITLTDYIYLVTGLHTLTMPTAVGNSNRYCIKNNHSANITVNTTLSQTIDGTTSIIIAPGDSVDLISSNSNWFII